MGPRLLIVSPYNKLHNFEKYVASRLLLWGLDEAGIRWEHYQPRKYPPLLSRYDAVLFWSFGHRKRNYTFYARAFEQQCRAYGLPIINSMEGCEIHHSFGLAQWKKHGIPCANFQRFRHFDDITLDYPLILRRDGVHQGKDMFLVRTPEEAREVIDRRLHEYETLWLDDHSKLPLDLAIEFVDTQYPDGYYRKQRCYVVGDRVIPRQVSFAPTWLVNYGHCVVTPQALKEDRQLRTHGEPRADLLVHAARALKSDVVAMDYTPRPDGSYILWEGNRHFKMMGDRGYVDNHFNEATGRTPAERLEDDHALGHALAELVMQRINHTQTVGQPTSA